MSLFFIAFFTIYGSVHCYFFLKTRQAFGLGAGASLLLALFLLLMTTAPLTVHALEKHSVAQARVLAYIGYFWMGFLFLFFSTSLLVDCYRGGLSLYGAVTHQDVSRWILSGRPLFLLPCAAAVAISFYGYFEALDLRTEHLVIPTRKLPPGTDRIRIAQVSDIHLGLIVREERLKKMLALAKGAEPDLFVSTGDLLDGPLEDPRGVARLISEVRAPLGKFAVTGNHEFYVGLGTTEKFCREAGLTLLRGETVTLPANLTVAGVDDPAGGRSGIARLNERELLDPLPRDRFILFLKHRPTVQSGSEGKFDLQLSGHLHRGQIFPFILLTKLFFSVKHGLSEAGGDSLLYLSRGTGTWGPPLRFLAPPEVTVIDLVRPR